MFAEIILPLPLVGTFTYSIPPELLSGVKAGSRVLVQFGKKKFYTGIVTRVHDTAPDYEVKPLMSVLDATPIVRYPQFRLWEWMAEYYLCTPGDVYRAAVPAGLKPESETYVTLNPDFELPDGEKFNEREASVIMLLEQRKRMKVSDLESESGITHVGRVIGPLLEAGVVNVDEKLVERYRARRETFIKISAKREDEALLHSYFDMTSRSVNQEKTLLAWLDLSGWLDRRVAPRDVTRSQLLEASKVSPAVLKAMIDKGIFTQEKRIVNRFNRRENGGSEIEPAKLSAEQNEALDQIRTGFKERDIMLLHGVTGSGKTEIYTHLIAAAMRDRNQVLYLVPEISLTTQLTDRLRRVLGDSLLVYHSKFSDNERVDIWRRVLSSDKPLVVLGARSAVFLPFAHLGLVVVDEEHESSYKQYDPAPRYNARDAAIMLARLHGAKVILGSATPSVETYYKALTGKFGLVTLEKRFEGALLPEVEIVDMKLQRKQKRNRGILSEPMMAAVDASLNEKRQSIIFQNRRGFAPVVVCGECGWTPKCQNCDVSLVYHKHTDLLKCHYCGYTQLLPKLCPACGQNSIGVFGYGTERIAEEVQQRWPESRISRMDLDTTRNKDSYQEIIEEFARHDTDILVGTQMVTKGLDFENVDLVGVVNADTLLNFPDFRSNERAFNMLEQVAGRAGRRRRLGRVVIQTVKPDDPILGFVANHDYAGYYASEIKERERYGYPPFTRVINIYLRNKDAHLVDQAAVKFTKRLKETFGQRVLGPERPFVSRVALWYIQSIMLKIEVGASMKKVKAILRSIYEQLASEPEMKSTQIYYDVDPA